MAQQALTQALTSMLLQRRRDGQDQARVEEQRMEQNRRASEGREWQMAGKIAEAGKFKRSLAPNFPHLQAHQVEMLETLSKIKADELKQANQAGQLGQVNQALNPGPTGRANMPLDQVLPLLRQQEQLEGQLGVTPEQSQQATALQRAQAGQGELERFQASEFERNIAHLPQAEQRRLRETRARTQALQRSRTSNTSISVEAIDRSIDRMESAVRGSDLTSSLMRSIEEDPTRAGFGARVIGAGQTVTGTLGSIAQVLGAETGQRFQERQAQFVGDLQGRIANGEVEGEGANRLLERLSDPSIALNEFIGLSLAYELERLNSGGRRFSIQAVRQWEERINLKDARGPEKVKAKLGFAHRQFREAIRREERKQRALAKLGGIDQGLFGQIPEAQQPARPRQGGAPAFEITEEKDSEGRTVIRVR